MNPQKPKKALRNLFSRTEPLTEDIPLEKENSPPALKSETKNNSTAVESIFSESHNNLNSFSTAEPVKDSSPQTSESLKNFTSSASESIEQIKESPVLTVLSTAEINKEHLHNLDSHPIKIEITGRADLFPSDAPSVATKSQIPPKAEEVTPYSFVKIQYNLDLFKAERGTWQEQDYISFINRIDQAQTDAFFLKGRLVSEIKEKFYLDNKRGWTLFCEDTLNMNYTTANQYIRVSQEFDVTSHQRKDFGFEHFKALLPLTKEERIELLTHTPNNLSVKSLRDIVTKKLQRSSLTPATEKNGLTTRNIVETLQKLKLQLGRLKNVALSQEEKWQLFGAFQNLSDEMNSISNSFISPTSEAKNEVSIAN